MGSEQRRKHPRVGYITQWFTPEPVAIPRAIARAVSSEGFAVKVLTGIPNYPTGVVSSGYRSWRPVAEAVQGFTVVRTPLYPSHDGSAVRRALNYLSFAASGAFRFHPWTKSADVNLVYSSPATAALPAMTARLRYGIPYVLIVQDVWPDSVLGSGMVHGRSLQVVRRVLTDFVDASYRLADHIIVISDGMKELLTQRGVPASKISVIYNWIDESEIDHAVMRGELRHCIGANPDEIVLLYAGNLGNYQELDCWVRAIGQLPPDVPVRLVICGSGAAQPRLQDVFEQVADTRVALLGQISQQQAIAYSLDADAMIVALRDDPLMRITIPSKFQFGLTMGRPLLVPQGGELEKLTVSRNCGLAYPTGDPVRISQMIARFVALPSEERSAMGTAARTLYREDMCQSIGAKRLAEVLSGAVGRQPAGSTVGTGSSAQSI